jgi:cation diffusion facilitator CzcD-associated flavoprotein CzcO
VVNKHDLRKYIKFNHRAVGATWQEDSSTWKVELQSTDSSGKPVTVIKESDILVQGVGTLNAWKYPEVPGLSSFEGTLMHTATWDDKLDLKGKSVAIIGNGASAVQVVAALQPGMHALLFVLRVLRKPG